ncbi:MAG: TonB-dependent receptor, partial [Acidobacteriaceae bacterium]|nr:TonB-dependent receptor [Acidobacteriaceae bacterium]
MSLRLGTAALLLLSFARFAGTQTQITSAQLSGRILDPNGAAIPSATVTLAEPTTGISRVFTTDTQGKYDFPLVPAGTYQLKIEKTGFDTVTLSNITLAVGQASTLDVPLKIGSVSETIDVSATAPLINTANADLGSEVSTRQVRDLPLNVRNPFSLVYLDSNVNNNVQFQTLNGNGRESTVDHDVAFFNFGGGRFGTTAFLLDGNWDTAGDWTAVIYTPSVDEVAEFRIQTNTFSPQFGWSSGNAVNVITKSGTSSFHGDAYEFLRNSVLDANSFFNNANKLSKPAFRRNQFGATAGGPLYIPGPYRQRNKTFIFGAYESLREQNPQTIITTVPTALQRTGDFSQTRNPNGTPVTLYNPFSTKLVNGAYVRDQLGGNVIPGSLIDPVAAKLLQFWPSPNRPGDPITGQNNFVFTSGLPSSADQYTLRVDHNLSDNNRLFGRWSQKRQYKTQQAAIFGTDDVGGPGSLAPNNKFNGALNYTSVISPKFLISGNFGYGRWEEAFTPKSYPYQPSLLGLPAILDSGYGNVAFPDIGVAGVNSLGSGQHELNPRDTISGSIDVTRIVGGHTLTAGFTAVGQRYASTYSPELSFSFDSSFTQGPNPTAANANTGLGFASFLLGTGSGSFAYTASPAYSKKLLGWYFNDEWKWRSNLTVNLGLRYDIQTPPSDRFGRIPYWTLNPNPIGTQVGLNLPGALEYTGGNHPNQIFDTRYSNVSPRLALSYSPWSKLTVRSGFGLFYLSTIDQGDYQGLSMDGFSITTPWVGSLNGVTPVSTLQSAFSTGLLTPPGRSQDGLTNVGLGANAIQRDRPTPYVEQWMAGIQYEALPNTVLQANYIGNHGVKLTFGGLNLNQLPPQYLALGNALLAPVANPFYGHITSGSLAGPTIPYGQLLRPYPQFTGVNAVQPPAAMSNYHALNLSATRRLSAGLQFLVSFTWSKYLSTSEGTEGWATSSSGVQNNYDTALEKSYDAADIPRSLVVSFLYEVPVGRGKVYSPHNKIVENVIGGWQVSAINTFKDGFPLSIRNANNNTNSFGGGQRPNYNGDPRLSQPSIGEWFNINAFAQPAAFTFGNVPRTTGLIRAP